MRPSYPPYKRQREEDLRYSHRINREIAAQRVRLVGDNIEPGIYPTVDALKMAEGLELDLVEIVPSVDPPVCRIIDFSKFIYEQKKKQKELKSRSAKSVVKEIRFGPNTDEHDFEFKLKHAKKFLDEGAKVKAFVHFKGRTIVHSERGETLLKNFIDELDDYGKIDAPPKLEGKRLIVMLSPKGKK